MTLIKIADLEFDPNNLSSEAANRFEDLRFIEQKVNQLQRELIVYQSARNSAVSALKSAIEKSGNETKGYDRLLDLLFKS